MHDPSFMALALIISEKCSKNSTKVSEPLEIGQESKLNVELTFTLQDVCKTQVSCSSTYRPRENDLHTKT